MQTGGEGARGAGGVAAWGALALALLAVAALFARALGGELVYDDLWLVARNPALADWERLSSSMAGAHWDFIEPDQALRVGYWRPLAMAALYVGRQLGDGEPWAYHALSLACHLGSVALVFLLVRRLVGSGALLAPFAAALLFGLHPVQVEATAWISALNDPLSGLLVLAALLSFVAWRQRGSPGAPIASPLLLMLALLAKESAVAWFALAPALDWALRAERRPILRAYAPTVGVLALYWLARVQVFDSAFAGFDLITSHLNAPASRAFTLRAELLGGGLALLAWPAQLNLFREVRPEIPWSDARLWSALGVLALWALALWTALRRGERLLAAALLCALGALAPAVLRVESTGRFPLSDRFLYLSVFGAALGLAVLLERLPRAAGLAALGLLAALSGARSFTRIPVWHDELSLFRDGAQRSPRSMYVHWGLGRVLLERFQRSEDPALLFEASDHFQAAQELALERPPDPRVLVTPFDEIQSSLGLGWYHLLCALHVPQECVVEEAELIFRALVDKLGDDAPGAADAHCGLGVALKHLGRTDEAESELRKATACNARHHESWFNLGRLALERQRWNDALTAFDRCVELAPDDVDSWVSLGMAAIELGLGERARSALGRARALAPDSDEPLLQLGVMAAREGRFEVALDFFEATLRIDGSNGAAHLLRGKALLQLQRTSDALAAFSDAARWLQEPSRDPGRPQQTFEAFYNAGVITAQRSPKDALPMLEEALARDPHGLWAPGLRAEVDKLRRALEAGQ